VTRREYGEVFLGLQSAVVRDKAGKSTKIRVPRAVKMASNEQMKDDFVREALIMLQLGDHDNIVRMVGVAVQQSPWLVFLFYFWLGLEFEFPPPLGWFTQRDQSQ